MANNDDATSSSASSSTPAPPPPPASAPPIIIPEISQQHPLQKNFREGPKGAYEVKRVENGFYVRVDMPGVQSEIHVHAVKMDNQTVRFQGFAPKISDWPLDESTRFYVGKMKVESEDFDAVSIEKTSVSNGCCRFFIKGATNVSLFLDNNTTGNVNEVGPPNNQLHLTPASLIIVGVGNEVKHKKGCSCCQGLKVTKYPTEQINEEMGHINPFVYSGVKGVFESKFEVLGDDSGAHRLYFRLDMPDCTLESTTVKIDKHRIFIKGYLGIANMEHDESGGRIYACDVQLRCSCCTFDASAETSSHRFDNGVFRMVVKVIRSLIVVKQEKDKQKEKEKAKEKEKKKESTTTTTTTLSVDEGEGSSSSSAAPVVAS